MHPILPAFDGAMNLYLFRVDNRNNNTGYQIEGTFTVQ
jgi:hypothetical protein